MDLDFGLLTQGDNKVFGANALHLYIQSFLDVFQPVPDNLRLRRRHIEPLGQHLGQEVDIKRLAGLVAAELGALDVLGLEAVLIAQRGDGLVPPLDPLHVIPVLVVRLGRVLGPGEARLDHELAAYARLQRAKHADAKLDGLGLDGKVPCRLLLALQPRRGVDSTVGLQ